MGQLSQSGAMEEMCPLRNVLLVSVLAGSLALGKVLATLVSSINGLQ